MRVASILHAVHLAGYVHRDVKPEHIVLDRNRLGELEVRAAGLRCLCGRHGAS
jgi:serine/threonine protein kinase